MMDESTQLSCWLHYASAELPAACLYEQGARKLAAHDAADGLLQLGLVPQHEELQARQAFLPCALWHGWRLALP